MTSKCPSFSTAAAVCVANRGKTPRGAKNKASRERMMLQQKHNVMNKEKAFGRNQRLSMSIPV